MHQFYAQLNQTQPCKHPRGGPFVVFVCSVTADGSRTCHKSMYAGAVGLCMRPWKPRCFQCAGTVNLHCFLHLVFRRRLFQHFRGVSGLRSRVCLSSTSCAVSTPTTARLLASIQAQQMEAWQRTHLTGNGIKKSVRSVQKALALTAKAKRRTRCVLLIGKALTWVNPRLKAKLPNSPELRGRTELRLAARFWLRATDKNLESAEVTSDLVAC